MANDLRPGFWLVNYHSVFGPHKMIIPTSVPSYSGIGDDPTYLCHDSSVVPFSSLVPDLVNALKVRLKSNGAIDTVTAYDYHAGLAAPAPINVQRPATAGTDTTTGWDEGVVRTYVFRTAAFGLFKILLMDTPTDNEFGIYTTLATADSTLVSYFESLTHPIVGRDGARPAFFKNLIVKINDRLRREYHLS